MLQIVILCVLTFSAAAQDVPAAIVVRPPAYTSVTATRSVKLACYAYGSPTPNLAWTDEFGTELQALVGDPGFDSEATVTISQETISGNGVTLKLSILEICHIDSAFTGNYTCTADNGVQGIPIAPSSATFFLNVTDLFTMPAAVVVHPPVNNIVEAESTVEFGCIAYGNPVPDVYWSRPGCSKMENSSAENVFIYSGIVTVNGIAMRKSALQICNVTTTDEAKYGCWADNGVTVGKFLAEPSFWFDLRVNVPTTAPPTTDLPSSGGTQDMTERPTEARGFLNEDNIPYLVVVVILVILVIVLGLLLICTVMYGLKMKKLAEQKSNKYSTQMTTINPGPEGEYKFIPDTKCLIDEEDTQLDQNYDHLDEATDVANT